MFDFSTFVTWLLGAIAVVGVLEWMKGFASSLKERKWKSVLLSLALPIVCFLVAFGKGGPDVMWNAFGVWSIAQLCYSLIVQSVQNAFKNKAASAIDSLSTALLSSASTDSPGRPEQ